MIAIKSQFIPWRSKVLGTSAVLSPLNDLTRKENLSIFHVAVTWSCWGRKAELQVASYGAFFDCFGICSKICISRWERATRERASYVRFFRSAFFCFRMWRHSVHVARQQEPAVSQDSIVQQHTERCVRFVFMFILCCSFSCCNGWSLCLFCVLLCGSEFLLASCSSLANEISYGFRGVCYFSTEIINIIVAWYSE